MGWVSATQYEPEFWGKMPAKPPVINPFNSRSAEFKVETKTEPAKEEVKVEPAPAKVVEESTPAVKRVAKKTTPKTESKPKPKAKTESDDDDKE